MGKVYWGSKITDTIGLHAESVLGTPVLELCGDERVLVENVKKVISFCEDEVLLTVCYGCIRVVGKGLVLDYLGSDRILIVGRILTIGIERKGDHA